MPKTAIILGASGATGGEVLRLLLNDSRYEKVKLFSRSSINKTHTKIEEYLVDLFELEKHIADFTADEVYCCIGTTKSKTPDKNTYQKIDYGIPVTAAALAHINKIPVFIVISALGANSDSRIFYNRTKGEMQEDVLGANIPKTHILQPSLIEAERKENRIMENIAACVMRFLNPLLFGGMAKYRSIKADTIAKAMLWLANNAYEAIFIPSDEIARLGKKAAKAQA